MKILVTYKMQKFHLANTTQTTHSLLQVFHDLIAMYIDLFLISNNNTDVSAQWHTNKNLPVTYFFNWTSLVSKKNC